MTALIVTLAIVTAFYLGWALSSETSKAAVALAKSRVSAAQKLIDDAMEDLAAETRAHAETKALVASLEADLIEAGAEASTHANHLEALLDATSEKPLTLVKGGRR